MKKKYFKLLLVILMVFSVTGCTKYLKDENNKNVQNVETGQNLPANILCRPEDENVIKLYEDNNIDIIKLPKCSEFKVTSGGYEGLWTNLFVKPLVWVIIKFANLFHNYGLAIIMITVLIRLVMYPFTNKAAMQSENLKAAQPELDKIERKYKNRQDQDAMMAKSQEILMVYKKHDINPMSGCLFSLIQIPLFFAFFEGLNRLPAVFEKKFLCFQMGTSPITGIVNGQYVYLLIIILVVATTYFSVKLNSGAMSEEQAAQMKLTSNILLIMIAFASFTVSTGIALYWITNSGFTIIQNLIVKRRKAA